MSRERVSRGFILITVVFVMLTLWVVFAGMIYYFQNFFKIENQFKSYLKLQVGVHNALIHLKTVINEDINSYDRYGEGVYAQFVDISNHQSQVKGYSYGEDVYYIYLKGTSSEVSINASSLYATPQLPTGVTGLGNHSSGDISLSHFLGGVSSVWGFPLLMERSVLARDKILKSPQTYEQNIEEISKDITVFSYGINRLNKSKKVNLRDSVEVNKEKLYHQLIENMGYKNLGQVQKVLCVKDHFDTDKKVSKFQYKGVWIEGYESSVRISECGWSQRSDTDPKVFFLELKNELNSEVKMVRWKLNIGGIERVLPDMVIPAKGFLILTDNLGSYKSEYGYQADRQWSDLSQIEHVESLTLKPSLEYEEDKISWDGKLKNGVYKDKKELHRESTQSQLTITYKSLSLQTKTPQLTRNGHATSQDIIGVLSQVYRGTACESLQMRADNYQEEDIQLLDIFECRPVGTAHSLYGVNLGSSDWRVPGMLNINTVSQKVMKSLPISEQMATWLYTGRYDQIDGGREYHSAVDLVKAIYEKKNITKKIKEESIKALLPLICYESQVFYFDILAQNDKGQKARSIGYIRRGWVYENGKFKKGQAKVIREREVKGIF